MIIGLLLAAGGYTGVVLSTKAIDETVDYAIYKLQDKGINVLIPVVFFIYCFIGAFASGDQIIAMVPVGLMFAKKLRLDPIIGKMCIRDSQISSADQSGCGKTPRGTCFSHDSDVLS